MKNDAEAFWNAEEVEVPMSENTTVSTYLCLYCAGCREYVCDRQVSLEEFMKHEGRVEVIPALHGPVPKIIIAKDMFGYVSNFCDCKHEELV
jgi:hypothetical protein